MEVMRRGLQDRVQSGLMGALFALMACGKVSAADQEGNAYLALIDRDFQKYRCGEHVMLW